MSQTVSSCDRCLQLRKTCLPRKNAVQFCGALEGTAPVRESITIETRPRIRTDSPAARHVDASDVRDHLSLDPFRTMDTDSVSGTGSDDENVEPKKSLPVLMGYDPKKQRSEVYGEPTQSKRSCVSSKPR